MDGQVESETVVASRIPDDSHSFTAKTKAVFQTMILQLHNDIVFLWLPSHGGMVGNTMANSAAKARLKKSVTPLSMNRSGKNNFYNIHWTISLFHISYSDDSRCLRNCELILPHPSDWTGMSLSLVMFPHSNCSLGYHAESRGIVFPWSLVWGSNFGCWWSMTLFIISVFLFKSYLLKISNMNICFNSLSHQMLTCNFLTYVASLVVMNISLFSL